MDAAQTQTMCCFHKPPVASEADLTWVDSHNRVREEQSCFRAVTKVHRGNTERSGLSSTDHFAEEIHATVNHVSFFLYSKGSEALPFNHYLHLLI